MKLKSKWCPCFGVCIQGQAYRQKYFCFTFQNPNYHWVYVFCLWPGYQMSFHKNVMNNGRTSNTSFYNTITSICTYLIPQTKIIGSISLLKLHLVIIGKHRVNIKIPNYILQLLKWKHLKEYTHITSSVTFSLLCTGGALDTHIYTHTHINIWREEFTHIYVCVMN